MLIGDTFGIPHGCLAVVGGSRHMASQRPRSLLAEKAKRPYRRRPGLLDILCKFHCFFGIGFVSSRSNLTGELSMQTTETVIAKTAWATPAIESYDVAEITLANGVTNSDGTGSSS